MFLKILAIEYSAGFMPSTPFPDIPFQIQVFTSKYSEIFVK
jgi:hypothetical protein